MVVVFGQEKDISGLGGDCCAETENAEVWRKATPKRHGPPTAGLWHAVPLRVRAGCRKRHRRWCGPLL